MQLQSPVTMMVFNRPEHTRRLFNLIAAQRPRVLLVVADGPRPDRADDVERCKAVRAVTTQVDWPCELLTNFSETNLQCRERFTTGLNWVFQQCEQAIILEDDCVPDPTFFRFCQEMLDRYKDHSRVMHVTGNNFQAPDWTCPTSYYFSRWTPCWGWATWRRAWSLFNPKIPGWPELKAQGWLSGILTNPREIQFWTNNFDEVYKAGSTVWDYQWTFASFLHKAISVIPAVNLVSNAGFGPEATHTFSEGPTLNRPTAPISFPLTHPTVLESSKSEDDYIFETLFDPGAPVPPGPLKRARLIAGRIARNLGMR